MFTTFNAVAIVVILFVLTAHLKNRKAITVNINRLSKMGYSSIELMNTDARFHAAAVRYTQTRYGLRTLCVGYALSWVVTWLLN